MAPPSTPRGWARCLDNVADVLRRGAWYPIVDETDDGKVVIEVRKKPVRVSRIDVAVRETPPDHWSIVVRTGVLQWSGGGGHQHVRRLSPLPGASGLQWQTRLAQVPPVQDGLEGGLVRDLLTGISLPPSADPDFPSYCGHGNV